MSDASPVEGSTMWMRCNLENGTGPIHYLWKHETRNGNISVFAEGNSSVINVTDVNRNHTGWFRCVASNAVNSESSNRLWLDTICKYCRRFETDCHFFLFHHVFFSVPTKKHLKIGTCDFLGSCFYVAAQIQSF